MCGIFGSIGPNDPNIYKLHILGMDNEVRGRDSCGLYWNGVVLRSSAIREREYTDYISTYRLKDWNGKNKINFGHVRNSSVGIISDENAHPVTIYSEAKKVRPTLIGAHNGTIYNIDELAKKYKVNVEDYETDSQKIFAILAEKHFDVLKEYQGSATLVFMYPQKDPNLLYIWKGKSKKSASSVQSLEERPLYMYIEGSTGQHYFSSREEGLNIINHDIDGKIIDLPCNQLLIYSTDKGLIDQKEYDRTEQSQSKTYDYHTRGANSYFRNGNENFTNGVGTRKTTTTYSRNTSSSNTFINSSNLKFENLIDTLKEMLDNKDFLKKEKNISFDISKEPKRIGLPYTQIVFYKGKYYVGERLIGDNNLIANPERIHIDMETNDRVYAKDLLDGESVKQFVVYEGIIFKDESSYAACIQALRKSLTGITMSPTTNLLEEFSLSFVKSTHTNIYMQGGTICHGFYSPLFSDRTYVMHSGYLIAVLDKAKTLDEDDSALVCCSKEMYNILDPEDSNTYADVELGNQLPLLSDEYLNTLSEQNKKTKIDMSTSLKEAKGQISKLVQDDEETFQEHKTAIDQIITVLEQV
jgi:hypothetical protein